MIMVDIIDITSMIQSTCMVEGGNIEGGEIGCRLR